MGALFIGLDQVKDHEQKQSHRDAPPNTRDMARNLRRKVCAAKPEMCRQMSTTNIFMDAATVVDLTPILCKLQNTCSGQIGHA